MTIINGKSLSKEEELHKAITRFDLPQVYADYLATEYNTFSRRLARLFKPSTRNQDNKAISQLTFLDTIYANMKTESIENQVFIMLGALEQCQKKWGEFPNHGALINLALKQDDLIQSVAQNIDGFVVHDMFNQPQKIQQHAYNIFNNFLKKHPQLLRNL